MARFIKRGNSWQYEISYKKQDGTHSKLRKSGFKTKREAKEAADEIEYNLKKGLQGDKQNILLSEYFKDWMNLYKKGVVSEITYRKYKDTLNNIERYMPNIILSQLTRPLYQRYLNKFAEEHMKSTVIKFNNHIRASLKDAVEEGLILFDPTRKAVIKGKESDKTKNDKFLDYGDFKRLMELAEKGIDPHYASPIMVVVAGATGMRFAELLGTTWNDINFEDEIIDIHKTWNYKMNCWGKTKNESSVRKIKIDFHTAQLLKEYKKAQKELFDKLEVQNPEQFIFYNSQNGLISNNAVTKYLRKKLSKIGVTKKFTLHGLRHTHASVLLYQGCDTIYVSKRLGHSSLDTTITTYLHIIKELDNKNDEMIDSVFDKIYKSN